MRAVGLKVLKNKLSEYVRLAAEGETVLVTDRDRVVAELVPPRAGRSDVLGDAGVTWCTDAYDAAAGADLLAVISGVFDAPDPATAVRAYLSCFEDIPA